MEPLDPAKNAEGSGFSKRRISSILKAPRKSTIVCRDPDQQENKVENTRPLEKRNSRRVSFAPANDVLLFAKDAKNASPARSPLQELMAAAAATTQNRPPEPEDGNQQIKGIENLLNAPLHASQQRDVVNVDTGNDFGEKTVMFSMEDAVMDITQSHTINIANDAELLGDISMQNYDILAGEDRKVTVDQSTDVSLSHIVNMKSGSVPIPTGRGSDLSVEKRNLSSKLLCLDPGFENFLASRSKPSANTVTTRKIPFAEPSSDETSSSLLQNKTQRADVDKENQVPKSHNSSRNVGESFERHVFCPEGDVDMDISEAQTGRILGVGDDPFQCLFPIEAMCAHTDKITPQMTEIQQQQSSKMLGSSDLKEKKSLINPLLQAPHQRPIVISDPKDKCREKTILADDECLDMTQSHTVNIASSSLAPVQSSANTLDAGFNNFLASLYRPSDPSGNPDTHRRKPITSPTSKTTNDANSSLSQHKMARPCAGKENWLSNTSGSIRKPFSGGITGTKDDTSLDLTETQTGRVPGLTGSDDPFQFLIPSEDVYPLSESRKQADVTSRQQSSGFRFPNHKGMETSIKPSVKSQLQRQQEKPEIEDDHQEKTVRFCGEDACMDVTQSQTVNISTDLKLQLYHNVDMAPSCGEKTVRFTVDDAPLDMTQCLTVNIDCNLVSDSVPSVRKQEIKTSGPPQHGSSSTHRSDPRFSNPLTNTSKPSDYSVQSYDGFAICPEDDVSIDMTEGHIAEILPLQRLLTTKGMHPQSVNLKKTEMTSQQQSNEAIGTSKYKAMDTSGKTSLKTKLQRHQVTFDAEDEGKEKTVRFTLDDACMDMTRSHTLNIATDLNMLQRQNVDLIPANSEKTVRFTADDATMDVTRSHTVNIATGLNMLQDQNVDLVLANRKKTMRLPADDTSMDVTRRHTSNIVSRLPQQSYQTVDRPAYEEKTMRFTADDATMDVTRSHTLNIATGLNMLQRQNVDLIPANSEKTVRFTAGDATMDVTKSHTVNIATDLNMLQHQNVDLIPAKRKKTMRLPADETSMDATRRNAVNIVSRLPQQSYQTVDRPAYEEKTVRFTADDASIDVTRSHTVNIATKFEPKSSQNVALLPNNPEKPVRLTASNTSVNMSQSQTVNMTTDVEPKSYQNMDFVPTCGERTTSTTNDANIDMTRSLTVNIASNFASGLVLTSEKFPLNHENLNFPVGVKKSDNETCVPHSNRPSLAYGVYQEFDNSLSKTTSEAADTLFPQETDSNVVLVPLKKQKRDMSTENEAPSLVLPVMEKTVNKTTDCPEIGVNMDMTRVQTCSILEQTCTGDTSQSLSSSQGPTSDLLLKTELTSQNDGALGSPISDDAEIKNPPNSLDSNETETIEENEPTPTAYQSQKMGSSPSTVDQDGDASRSRKSRRMSLANLQSKVRRLSHIINTAPDAVAMDSCTAPLPQLNQDLNKNSNDETTSLPEVEPELEMVNLQDNTQAFGLKQAEQHCATSTATPFTLKTKTLISRLSVGGFKPKLPQRDNAERTKKVASGEPTKTVTVNITSQLNNSDNDVSDIYDEELGSYEDMSETLETRSPDKNFEKEGLFYEFNMFEPLEENVFEEESVGTVHGQKRSLPEDEDNKEDEKRLKASTKFTELTPQSDAVEFDSDIASTRITTHTIDSSSTSHTASRCESTIKNSLFESQIEDYDSDAQNKLEDGTITVLEFFKLFNIDFVIHNPRQSIVAGKLQSDTDTKPLDLLKGRHISLPKQLVYKMDIKTLTEKVEGLKVRMRDLDKPLKTVNRHLWEEMRHSSEKVMKSFGAKLKEQNNFFRKTSKIQSHEMKEVLYSTLVRANQEEQQKLRGTVEEADGMIKSLDECICELEAELAAVEENGSEEKPSLASLQEETNNVTEALADKSRQISELEMQKTQNLSKLNRLKAETRNLESHINMLNMVNEWKLREKRENCTVYAFLHETMLLQLVFEKADDTGSEQKVTNIAFKLELDDEKSDFYARLVHKLVSKFIERETAWVEKYPTQRHVPKLLRDVSLVVSRCRLLGEELRLLKMWGGLRLDILDISCMDTRLHIVFSSLKKCSKFEVVFAVSLIDQLCVLHVEGFKNMIGSTTMQQIEEIVASFSPGKNLLTKIVRKIHNTLLS